MPLDNVLVGLCESIPTPYHVWSSGVPVVNARKVSAVSGADDPTTSLMVCDVRMTLKAPDVPLGGSWIVRPNAPVALAYQFDPVAPGSSVELRM